jgi:hypothetical protein
MAYLGYESIKALSALASGIDLTKNAHNWKPNEINDSDYDESGDESNSEDDISEYRASGSAIPNFHIAIPPLPADHSTYRHQISIPQRPNQEGQYSSTMDPYQRTAG